MNALELLRKDHQLVARVFEQLEAAAHSKGHKREDLFNRLRDELRLHSTIEERVFYPALAERPESRESILESLEEHKLVDQLLDELDATALDDEHWPAKLKVLKENVERHVESEEADVFPKARQLLGEQKLAELGKRLAEEKKQLKAEA
jgi:iron-sulfur cluster repair protein YtfE (RIC family)